MHRATWMVLVTVAAVAFPVDAEAQGRSSPTSSNIVYIDGAKNPELVPRWNAWETAFHVFAGGIKTLPLARHLSAEEIGLAAAEAEAHAKREAEHRARILRLAGLLGKQKRSELDARQRELKLEYRRQILDARDRLMAAVSTSARLALAEYIDSVKASTTITMNKSELAFFLQPE